MALEEKGVPWTSRYIDLFKFDQMVANHAFDCIGAKSYGMRTAFIDRRKRPFSQTPHQPDLIIANFTELTGTLA
jgi:FMN phosphatase YigB (HAD superfamily)